MTPLLGIELLSRSEDGCENPSLLDLGRRHKRVAFLIDQGERVTPVITPDDPRRAAATLRS